MLSEVGWNIVSNYDSLAYFNFYRNHDPTSVPWHIVQSVSKGYTDLKWEISNI